MEWPPSIFEWIEHATQAPSRGSNQALAHILLQTVAPETTHSPKSLTRTIGRMIPRITAISAYIEKMNTVRWSSVGHVELMLHCGINRALIETLPHSVLMPLKDALSRCQANPPTTWTEPTLQLVGRDDLILLTEGEKGLIPHSSAFVSYVLAYILIWAHI